jgi:hypothetical protein
LINNITSGRTHTHSIPQIHSELLVWHYNSLLMAGQHSCGLLRQISVSTEEGTEGRQSLQKDRVNSTTAIYFARELPRQIERDEKSQRDRRNDQYKILSFTFE